MALGGLTADALFELLPEPALVLATNGDIAAANRLARELFEVEGTFGKINVTDLLPEPERERLDPLAWMDRWAIEPAAPELQYVYLTCRTRRGNEKHARVRVSRFSTDTTYYLVVLHDITAEQTRQRNERDAHRIAARTLAISADAIVTADKGFRIITLNRSAEELFGYRTGDLVGKPLSTLVPGRFREVHEAHVTRFAAEPAPSRLMGNRGVITGLTKHGEEVSLEASIAKVTVGGQLVFSAHLRDRRDIEESNARFRDLFDHAEQAMALLTPDGLVLEMNSAAKALLSNADAVVGEPFATLPWWSDDPAGTAQALSEAINVCNAGNTFQTRAVLRDGQGNDRTLDVSLRPITRNDTIFTIMAEGRELSA